MVDSFTNAPFYGYIIVYTPTGEPVCPYVEPEIHCLTTKIPFIEPQICSTVSSFFKSGSD